MPILDCTRDGQKGKKSGNDGFCFIGDVALGKAEAQGRAIKSEDNKKHHNKKGVAGKGTGSSARAAIQKAIDGGHTLEEIGRAAGRDASTISAIRSGEIKNPPPELADAIRRLKPKKKT